MVDRNEIVSRVTGIVVKQLDVDAGEADPKHSFVDDLGADSLDIVELVMAMEEEFGFDIPDEEAENIRTVGNAIDYITANHP